MIELGDEPSDVAEIVFDTEDLIPVAELADSFRALDTMFARGSQVGARLAVAEIRKGSIVTVLAPFMPMMGQAVSLMSSAVEVSDFVKRLRDGLNAFAGIDQGAADTRPELSREATEIAALVKPLTGRSAGHLGIAHVKYRSKSKERIVEVEASYSSVELDRIAINSAKALEQLIPTRTERDDDQQPSLLREVVLALQQTNTGPSKERGKTADRGIIRAVSDKPLPVYFAKTVNDLKSKMVTRSTNPFRQPYTVDVLVEYQEGAAKSYTVIEVHGPYSVRTTPPEPDLLSQLRPPETA